MQTTKIATLEHSRPRRNTRLLGIGVGLILSVLLLAAASTAYMSGIFVSANDDAPRELIVRSVTDNSTQLYWTTQNETQGLIQYGTNSSELSLIAPEVIAGKEHTIDLTLLKPQTTYYFQLKIGDKVFNNGGLPWTFATKKATDASNVSSDQPASAVCPQTNNCAVIKSNLGLGCTTLDYAACLQRSK